MNLLIIGGCGFLGSNLLPHLLRETEHNLVNLDGFTHAATRTGLREMGRNPRYRFVGGSACDGGVMEALVREADAVLHLPAGSHVGGSTAAERAFVERHVTATQTLLDVLRRVPDGPKKRLVHVSTVAVFGGLPLEDVERRFDEECPYQPSGPVAASMAASDLLVKTHTHTFGLNACVTHAASTFGPWQAPTKVLPLFLARLLAGETVPLCGDGKDVRDWLHVEDHCSALMAVLERGQAGETYAIGADNERSILEMTNALLAAVGLNGPIGQERIQPVADRAGHDRRYAIDASKIRRELGWRPTQSDWPGALVETANWYRENKAWWKPLLSRGRLSSGRVKQEDETRSRGPLPVGGFLLRRPRIFGRGGGLLPGRGGEGQRLARRGPRARSAGYCPITWRR